MVDCISLADQLSQWLLSRTEIIGNEKQLPLEVLEEHLPIAGNPPAGSTMRFLETSAEIARRAHLAFSMVFLLELRPLENITASLPHF